MKAEGGETSATLQPFFTLQLDIQHEMVGSVEEALLQNFASEQLDGYICSKTRQEVEASRNLSLEDLPPILVLHLKRYSEKLIHSFCDVVRVQKYFDDKCII